MNVRLLSLLAALLGAGSSALAGTVDIPIGFLPPAWVVDNVRKTLSPQGKFVVLNATGVVRVTDSEEKIQDVYRVLGTLQKAPATVALNLSFITYGKKSVTKPNPAASAGGDEFPFPRKFSPPKIMTGPNGSVTVVPTQPSQFTSRATGSSTAVPATIVVEEPTKQLARRVLANSITEKPAPVVLLAKVDDLKGLHDFAVKVGAVGPQEPPFTSAGTELLLKTELVGAELRVTITPQIVLPPPASGQEVRRVPVKACSAEIGITRSIPSPTGKLPLADAEFYRLFMGVQPGGAADVIALNLTGNVQFVGSAPVK